MFSMLFFQSHTYVYQIQETFMIFSGDKKNSEIMSLASIEKFHMVWNKH